MRGIALLFAATVPVANAANAQVLAQRLPGGEPEFVSTRANQSDTQNFLTQIVLGPDATLASMTIWTDASLVNIGSSTTIKIRLDVAGSPADTNLYELIAPVADVGTSDYSGIVGATVYFSPISLGAGTYWIGLSGTGSELGWTTFDIDVPAPDYQRQLSGDTVFFTPAINTLAYSIGGLGTSVPEPATWAMMFLGLGGIGVALRRRSGPAHA